MGEGNSGLWYKPIITPALKNAIFNCRGWTLYYPQVWSALFFQSPHPGRLQPGDLPVHRTFNVMGTGQVTGADQKFIDDLPAGKNKGSPKQLCPPLAAEWMMFVQPAFEGTEFRSQVLDVACVLNNRPDL